MLKIHPKRDRSMQQGPLYKVLPIHVLREMQVPIRIQVEGMRNIGQHRPERRLRVERVKDPENELKASSRLAFNHERCPQAKVLLFHDHFPVRACPAILEAQYCFVGGITLTGPATISGCTSLIFVLARRYKRAGTYGLIRQPAAV